MNLRTKRERRSFISIGWIDSITHTTTFISPSSINDYDLSSRDLLPPYVYNTRGTMGGCIEKAAGKSTDLVCLSDNGGRVLLAPGRYTLRSRITRNRERRLDPFAKPCLLQFPTFSFLLVSRDTRERYKTGIVRDRTSKEEETRERERERDARKKANLEELNFSSVDLRMLSFHVRTILRLLR